MSKPVLRNPDQATLFGLVPMFCDGTDRYLVRTATGKLVQIEQPSLLATLDGLAATGAVTIEATQS